ncbi:hypothetical protein [Prosthecobacter fluviatilis]|uniref:N-acetylmuramoyl-L-alanine amidase n=1 Tax=Prosthecobacter fluviatilis TaxID=445931 RepID=A0ABW0KTF7_9BACT
MRTLHWLFTAAFICLAYLTGCGGNRPTANWNGEVEVAPGEWLRIEGQEGRAWFRCQWNGKTVYWAGAYHRGQAGYYDLQHPVSLRSWKGALYLIYKQINLTEGLTQFAYCRIDQNGTAFDEIKRQDFPRQIATQNIGMHQEGIKHDEDHKEVDNLKILRDLDVTNRYFHNSTTGWIWYHLETGKTREELDPTIEEALAFYADFVRKYHPIALPTLIKPAK